MKFIKRKKIFQWGDQKKVLIKVIGKKIYCTVQQQQKKYSSGGTFGKCYFNSRLEKKKVQF